MKSSPINLSQLVKTHSFWLLTLATSLSCIYFTLIWKAEDLAHLGMSLLFWLAVITLLREKWPSLNLNSDLLSTILGTVLIVIFYLKSLTVPTQTDYFLRIAPFLGAIGLSLVASSLKGIVQYWRELMILFFLGVPAAILTPIFDPSETTAKFTHFLLWYTGFDVTRDGVYVLMPSGAVKVYSGCSGLEAMNYLLGLSIICLLLYPTGKRFHKIITPVIAIIIGFVINSLRVALMLLLVNSGQTKAFYYWHEGEGSLIFGLIEVMVFGCFYLFLMRQDAQPSGELKP
ncbi:Exosortase EpsH-related protein [Planktothrix tepida]|uniref:Exosortase EpsH-related protein n=1 Tax=Planktothrix tepida PCC 9214 TaxID=671072 RepID=A0A1J1LJC8_9CYAN|nr:cyanoexosortase A [Planktothrix tepida]CAD5983396.1 Exosortase EpsH-related protein [Planktothrix tepida]CUR32294.1 Exosortase EpsH-related protein [Planktothrix tepida PCC 9214]